MLIVVLSEKIEVVMLRLLMKIIDKMGSLRF